MSTFTQNNLNTYYNSLIADIALLNKDRNSLAKSLKMDSIKFMHRKDIFDSFSEVPLDSDDASGEVHYLTKDECYNELASKTKDWLEYSDLDEQEKERVFNLFNIFFHAQYQYIPKEYTLLEKNKSYLMQLTPHYHTLRPKLTKRTFEGLSLESGSDGDLGKCAVILIFSVFTLFSFLALYYLLNRMLNCVERFICDENWLKASIQIASTLAGAAAGACLGFYIVAPLIMYIGYVIIGMANPMNMAIAGVVLTGLLMSALACLVTNAVQDKAFEKSHAHALDPKDAKRFELTAQEEQVLRSKGFNIDIVHCALIALRNDMDVERVPSLLSRWISRTPRMETIKYGLDTVRALKNGTYNPNEQLRTSGMIFDLAMKDEYPWEHNSYTPEFSA